MPIPLIWLGVGTVALLASSKYANQHASLGTAASLPGSLDSAVQPINGAIVTCGVYGLFEHTGIWVDGKIIELKGNGLIRSISPSRFLQERSGDVIYVACDENNTPLIQAQTVNVATSYLYSYSEYDVIRNNCHKFVWRCISGENTPLTLFSELNQKLADLFSTSVYWQPIQEETE